jgi:hypothetical protein
VTGACAFCGRPLKASEAVWLAPHALAGGATVRCRDSACARAATAAIEREHRNRGRRVRELHGRIADARGRAPRQGYPYADHPRRPRYSTTTGRATR